MILIGRGLDLRRESSEELVGSAEEGNEEVSSEGRGTHVQGESTDTACAVLRVRSPKLVPLERKSGGH